MSASVKDISKIVDWGFKKGYAILSALIHYIERLAKQVRVQGLWTIKSTRNVHHQIGLHVRNHGWRRFFKIAFFVIMIFVGFFLTMTWAPIRAFAK
jgi:hypothetical protein